MPFDGIDILIISLILLGVIVSLINSEFFILNTSFFYGFKYDFVPLVAFIILRRVPWSAAFTKRAFAALLGMSVLLAAYAVTSLWLPPSFFHALGYSDLHSLYQVDGPLAAFQQIEGVALRRAQSTMSGPNQLGLWLLIPLSILLVQRKAIGNWQLAIGVLLMVAIFLSMSRAAVLAAIVILALFFVKKWSRRQFLTLAGVALLGGVLVCMLVPDIVLRATSTSGHIQRPLEAIEMMIQHPFGLGLGTAGPASNRVSDTCVYLEAGADASWAADRPALCVFVGESQVQPEAPCHCPLLPENWYLQLGVELGVLGFALFVALVVLLLRRLPKHQPVFYAFVGVSIAALFLHAWEDSAVAYTVWLLVAVLRK